MCLSSDVFLCNSFFICRWWSISALWSNDRKTCSLVRKQGPGSEFVERVSAAVSCMYRVYFRTLQGLFSSVSGRATHALLWLRTYFAESGCYLIFSFNRSWDWTQISASCQICVNTAISRRVTFTLILLRWVERVYAFKPFRSLNFTRVESAKNCCVLSSNV